VPIVIHHSRRPGLSRRTDGEQDDRSACRARRIILATPRGTRRDVKRREQTRVGPLMATRLARASHRGWSCSHSCVLGSIAPC
jgi:hypothetical protein